ncbi:ATP-binding protein [Pseudomonas aeruginosa]|uniref:ATP-binding protein n=1 Tax=Pseudomonas aeruginosa TaxID=287 RepID=UPI0008FB5AD2|nr:ATP-binding protein [Pseudomonas aeruginosa]KSD35115.2 hypothetical protein AO901_34255 [Pseudomonas aeruginosa]KSE14829.2 hypothetical protein AO922_34345 [Pseudomonas aeruginosa]
MGSVEKAFKLEFSNRVIEHLGIKLYQNKPSNVVAEFLSNSWDADATKVHIELKGGDGSPVVVITDNGRGMTRDELTDEFLVIGRNRRDKPTDRTPGGRLPMGRKGIGKLAGFGIAGKVDVISCPNRRLRNSEGEPEKYYWLRFSLQELLAKANTATASNYEPDVLADGVSKEEFLDIIDKEAYQGYLERYQEILSSVDGEGGVVIVLKNVSLKKTVNPDVLLRAMGRRFTVAMLRPDFKVCINQKEITPDDALPPLHDFGFGDWNNPLTDEVDVNGIKKPVKYWIRFVNLPGSDWSIENAGIGIYAHGKIAQDRPFFFDVKGKEILSRYLYGVVEADWLDELPTDVVSTDRRSVDWETDSTEGFHKWGAAKLGYWLEEFRKWRKKQPKKDTIEKIRKLNAGLSGTEEEALAELLSEVLDNLSGDEEAKEKATLSFTEAWVHAPTRKITQGLWEQIFSSMNSDTKVFADLVDGLRKSMVPEAMGLAVTMSQRIAAITVLRKMIEDDKTETHLQRLIETFPWLLGPQWERLTANQNIRTLIEKKHKPDPEQGEWSLGERTSNLRPDFVFLSDAGEEKELIVFELKGPEAGKTLQPAEYDQLNSYLRIIQNVYTSPSIKISGVLVGHEKGGIREYGSRISVRTWGEVLVEARSLHVSYLKSLLLVSDPKANDIRLQQISDFGGKETLELLSRFGNLEEFPEIITKTLGEYSRAEKLVEGFKSVSLTEPIPDGPVGLLPPPDEHEA